MPIDLKWVRQDPQQVQEWQRLRNRPECLVSQVLENDKDCRQKLQTLQLYKRKLHELHQQLRPPKKHNHNKQDEKNESSSPPLVDRQKLLDEKKELETKIQQAESLWKEATEKTQKSLWKLASPVDGSILTSPGRQSLPSGEENIQDEKNHEQFLSLHDGAAALSSLGVELMQAWRQYTAETWNEFSSVELPRGIPVLDNPSRNAANSSIVNTGSSLDPDAAHAILGCCDFSLEPKTRNENMDCNKGSSLTMSPCPICNLTALSGHEQTGPPVVMLPTWIRMLAEYLPPKSIWGDSQLPVYAAAWSPWLGSSRNEKDDPKDALFASRFGLELVALTASSIVDAREVQKDILNRLRGYFEGLLVGPPNRTLERQVAAPDLHCHEWSRVEIVVEACVSEAWSLKAKRSSPTRQAVCLGWVSCWGDSASRSLDMAFAGGGVRPAGKRGKKACSINKGYVHVVQASIVDPSTWKNILLANCKTSSCTSGREETLVGIPPALVPYLRELPKDTEEESNSSEGTGIFVALQDLTVGPRCKKNMIFGPLRDNGSAKNSRGKPKFPPVWELHGAGQQGTEPKTEGQLSCPFDFLFR